MVFCSKCGSENLDDAKYCLKCGTILASRKDRTIEDRGQEFGKKIEQWGENFGEQMEDFGNELGRTFQDECFGLPHGGAIIGIIIGVFIVVIGASLALGLEFDVWGRWFGSGVLIVIGLIVLISALYGVTRRRR